MKRRIIAMVLTIFLGAGAGHIYLRKFLKAAILIGANFALASVLLFRAINDPMFSSMGPMEAVREFIKVYSHRMAYHDAGLAAILAYALVDVWRLTVYDGKTNGKSD